MTARHIGVALRKSLLWSQAFRRIRTTTCMAASSEFSRRRQKKSVIPKTEVSTLKGFPPKRQSGTRIQKKDQSHIEEKAVDDAGETELDIQASISNNTAKRRAETLEEAKENYHDDKDTIDEEAYGEVPPAPVSNVEKHKQREEYEEDGKSLETHQVVMSYCDKSVAEVITCGALGSEVDIAYTQDQVTDFVKEDQDLKSENEVGIRNVEPLVEQKEHVDMQSQRKLREDLAEENVARGNKEYEEDEKNLRTHQGVMPYSDKSVAKAITNGAQRSEVNLELSDVKSSKSGILGDTEYTQDLVVDEVKEDQDLKSENDVDICNEESLVEQKEHADRQAQKKLREELAAENLTRGSKECEEDGKNLMTRKEVMSHGDRSIAKVITCGAHGSELDIEYNQDQVADVVKEDQDLKSENDVDICNEESLVEQKEHADRQAQKKLREELAEENLTRGSKECEEDGKNLMTHKEAMSHGDRSIAKVITCGAHGSELDIEYNQDQVADVVKEDQDLKSENEVDICNEESLVEQKEHTDLQARRKLQEDLAEENLARGDKEYEEDRKNLRTHQGAMSHGDKSVAEVITCGTQGSEVDPRLSDVKSSKSGTLDDIEYTQDQVVNGVKKNQDPKSETDVDIYNGKSLVERKEHTDLQAQRKLQEDLVEENLAQGSEIDPGDVKLSESGTLDDIECTQDQVVDGVKEDQDLKSENDVDICNEESLVEQKEHVDLQAQRKLREDLAEENLARGNKVFVLPQVVKADTIIEVFLNRSVSTLVNEHEVLIKGAFNGWRWQSFAENLSKTDLKGDWWSCRVYIPKEAYQIDFVFFNGSSAYDNNSSNDFLVPVEGGLDESEFENFLLEEEQWELERQAEEQRRRDAEKAASEADRSRACMEVRRRREAIDQVREFATKPVDNLWTIESTMFKGKKIVRIYYNRSSRDLQHATEIWIHGGYNNWSDGLSVVERLQRSDKKHGDWWYVEVVIPDEVVVLDWVFADGQPHKARVYENNYSQDFHAIIPQILPVELYWIEEENKIYRKLQEARMSKGETVHREGEITEEERILLNIVCTDPVEVQAGKLVTVMYNPSSTVLSGKPEIWFRCSFNRSTHRNGPLPPQKMECSENGIHVKATG